ncbi:hypothetical protein YC2023_078580 [Brassica napus]
MAINHIEKFVKESSILLVTVLDSDPSNHPYTDKFFVSLATRVESLKAKYREVATSYKGQGLFFLVGDAESGQHTLQYFGLGETQVPLIIILTPDNKKYLESRGWYKLNIQVFEGYHVKELRKIKYKLSKEHVSFKKGKLPPIKKSQPIPAENNKPVKVVVAESLDDIVYKSGKNGEQHLKTFNNTYFDLLTKQKLIKTSIYPPVLIEFYAPSCGHCQVSPILDEVALKLQNDPSVIIAKLDATENDIPSEPFDGKGFPPDHLLEISEWKRCRVRRRQDKGRLYKLH